MAITTGFNPRPRSHILNGDMRLNLRLIGPLHGLLVLGLVGQLLQKAKLGCLGCLLVPPLVLLGFGFEAAGAVGTFFASLIQAAVSREREFLADASAVQFTRNPGGLAGALKKIGGNRTGSRIGDLHAAEASHLFFGAGTKGVTSPFPTHPPLGDRIRQLDPAWDGAFVESTAERSSPAVGQRCCLAEPGSTLYEAPNGWAGVVARLPQGTVVKLDEWDSGFAKVTTNNRQVGYLGGQTQVTTMAGDPLPAAAGDRAAAVVTLDAWDAGLAKAIGADASGSNRETESPVTAVIDELPEVVGFVATASSDVGGGEMPNLAQAVESIGHPTRTHLDYAAHLINHLPAELLSAVHEPYSARAVVYALLIDQQAESRRLQLNHLSRCADQGVIDEMKRLFPLVEQLDVTARLPLVEMAMPALRSLTQPQYERFKQNVCALVLADKTISVFEWALQRILLLDLDEEDSPWTLSHVRSRRLDSFVQECQMSLSTLSYFGHAGPTMAEVAFTKGWQQLGLPATTLHPQDECGLDKFDIALTALAAAAEPIKRQVLSAAAACISADLTVTANEAELLRVMAALLGCPMPPLCTGPLSEARRAE